MDPAEHAVNLLAVIVHVISQKLQNRLLFKLVYHYLLTSNSDGLASRIIMTDRIVSEVLTLTKCFDHIAAYLKKNSSIFDEVKTFRDIILPVDIEAIAKAPLSKVFDAYILHVLWHMAEETVILHDLPDPLLVPWLNLKLFLSILLKLSFCFPRITLPIYFLRLQLVSC
jgi:hypothetical protein